MTPNEGASVRYAMNRYRYRQMMGRFKIYDELLSTYVACLRLKIYGEPESPHERAC